MENLAERQRIAERLLGASLDDGGFAPCPGREGHSKPGGKRDFRVVLTGAPTGFCFHASCAGEVDAFNERLRKEIWAAENGGARRHVEGPYGPVAPKPRGEKLPWRVPLDKAAVREAVRLGRLTAERLEQVSPIDPRGVESGEFLEALFSEDERVLVFVKPFSQGDFAWWVGKGGFRLGDSPRTRAVRSALPAGAPDGVWFLNNPVTGQWVENPVSGKPSRRTGACVTDWRYLVLESDELKHEEWLRVLGRTPLPVAAVYTSGGRSVHALLRINAGSKGHWDTIRDGLARVMCPLGADPGAMTAVRLTRLPGAKRGDREQRLLFLSPAARVVKLEDLKPRE